MKKKILFGSIAAIFVVLCVWAAKTIPMTDDSGIIASTDDSDIAASTEKYVGSEDYIFFKEDITDIKTLLDDTQLIAIGYATDNGETTKESAFGAPKEMEDKYNSKFNKSLTMTYTYTNFRVETVLYGDSSIANSDIVIRQYGEAGSDRGETKLKNNEKVLLLLEKVESDKYWIVGLENGAFDIDEENNIVSHGNDTAIQPYENKNINTLLKDIGKQKDLTIKKID